MSQRCLQCGVDLGTAPATDMYCNRHKTKVDNFRRQLVEACKLALDALNPNLSFNQGLAQEAYEACRAALAAAEETGQ